jgi:hypothetical protein
MAITIVLRSPVPLANLHLTMLKKIGITADKFADSNALVPESLGLAKSLTIGLSGSSLFEMKFFED